MLGSDHETDASSADGQVLNNMVNTYWRSARNTHISCWHNRNSRMSCGRRGDKTNQILGDISLGFSAKSYFEGRASDAELPLGVEHGWVMGATGLLDPKSQELEIPSDY